MRVYKRETAEIIRRYLTHRVNLSDCLAMLNMALASVIGHLTGEQLPELQKTMQTNTRLVMEELGRRELYSMKQRLLRRASSSCGKPIIQ